MICAGVDIRTQGHFDLSAKEKRQAKKDKKATKGSIPA
jgi:hypothetical protein